jgi:Phage-related protein
MARSPRARRGGGTEIALNPNSGNGYSISTSITLGSQRGANWFGPGSVMSPQAPPEVAGRAWDYPQGININPRPRQNEMLGFGMLRTFADSYDLLRIIVETRKDQMERLRWVIQPKDSKEKLTTQKKNKMKELTKFFRKPDGEHGWNAWLRMILEDLFVIDAVTLHRRRTRGGKLVALDQIDGATIKRVLDDWGRTPEDPKDIAYQQILHGMPAVNYDSTEMLYRPRNLRINKAYGFSPVEQIIMTINIALRRQVFQLNFFTEGNMPPALIGVPEDWTPDQIRTFQIWFDNMLAGNLAERSRARFVPAAVGKTYIPTQETELFGKAEEWLARVVCFAFSVSPQPFLQMMNRATAETATETAAVEGLTPIQNWVKDMIDTVLEEDLDAEEFEFIWKGDDELDPFKRQQITSGYLKDGLITINEGRVDAGREPYDDPQFDQPMFMTSNGLAPLTLTDASQGSSERKPAGQGPGVDKPAEGKDGKGVNLQAGGQGSSNDNPAQVVAKINDLIGSGDEDALVKFLATLKLGAASLPAPEETDNE